MTGTGMAAFEHKRMNREFQTVRCMIGMYCRGHHAPAAGALCAECAELLEYARVRLGKCPFQEGKTTCAKCPIHCYTPGMREKTRAVMRYAGPRMLFRHPVLTLFHYLDGLRKKPETPKRRRKTRRVH